MKKWLFNIVGTIFILSVIGCNNCTVRDIQKPNILFILLDDLGKEWFHCYGARDIQTPTIDQLAREGMVFENCYSMPQSTPTRVTLLTGQYPYRHGWVNHYDVPRWGHGARFDSQKNPSFAKIMQKLGYKTCVAGKWQVNDFRLEPDIMKEHGFDSYCMWTGAEGGDLERSGKRYWDPYIHEKSESKTYEGQFGEDVFSDFIIDFMRKNKEEPMLVYYPMCLPHLPYTTTPNDLNVKGGERFKAMIRYVDFILKKIINSLEKLQIRDRTLIFLTSDNGTSNSITGSLDGRLVRGGKSYLTENGINVPFIVNCPELIPKGERSDVLIDFTDLLPSFVDIAGGTLPEEYVFDGYSFADVLWGESVQNNRRYIMSMGGHPATLKDGRVVNSVPFRDRVIRNKRYKAYFSRSGVLARIYDLKEDPMELSNLMYSTDLVIQIQKEEFKEFANKWPETDLSPFYTKADTSFWDVDPVELHVMNDKAMRRSNMAPKPR